MNFLANLPLDQIGNNLHFFTHRAFQRLGVQYPEELLDAGAWTLLWDCTRRRLHAQQVDRTCKKLEARANCSAEVAKYAVACCNDLDDLSFVQMNDFTRSMQWLG